MLKLVARVALSRPLILKLSENFSLRTYRGTVATALLILSFERLTSHMPY